MRFPPALFVVPAFVVPILVLAMLAFAGSPFPQQFKSPDNLGPDVPTPPAVVDEMLKAAKLQAGETLYDLGCGDGRILIAATRYGAKAVGIEMSRDIYEKTVSHIKDLNLQDRIQVINGNALHVDLSRADVVTLYLLTSSNDRLKPALAKLHPGARVVSHDYRIPGWTPSFTSTVTVMRTPHVVYVYEIGPKS